VVRIANLQEEQDMAYDLLIKNGRVIDGSGMPAFRGDVAVSNGKIVATGKLRDSATRTIDADGLVVAPGFVDNHCHYDAQVTWDPLCTFSCYHGATSVVIGNCSLALAPVRRGAPEVRPVEAGLFGGRVQRKGLSLWDRLFVWASRTMEADRRDWDAIHLWARDLAPRLRRPHDATD
jgi:hypothetical protein